MEIWDLYDDFWDTTKNQVEKMILGTQPKIKLKEWGKVCKKI